MNSMGNQDIRIRAIALFIAVLFSAFPIACPFDEAHAEVRKADVVMGTTVGERGLSVSESPSIKCEHAALVSSDGEVYFARDGSGESQIASITKVMTAIVAIENADPSLKIPVSATAAEIGESSAGLQEGDVMSLDAALKALLVPSGNDAAVAIAEAVGATLGGGNTTSGEDAVKAFVAAMNDKARELGLENTVYENPHGLDDGEYEGNLHSTALDQARVACCAMGYQQIRDIVGGGSTTIEVMRNGSREAIDLETTDLLLDMYSYAIGIKTGVTNLAGPSFMGAANKNGSELYAIVLDSEDEYSRFEDAKAMFEWAFDHFIEFPFAHSDEWTTMRIDGSSREVPVIAEVPHLEWIDRTVKATLRDPDAAMTIVDLEGNVSQDIVLDELHGTIEAGDKVGSIAFMQHNEKIAEMDLVACERLDSPNPIDTVAIWWQRFTQGLEGDQAHATERVYNVMPIIKSNKTAAA